MGQCLVVIEMLGSVVCWFGLLKSTVVILALKDVMINFPFKTSGRPEASNQN